METNMHDFLLEKRLTEEAPQLHKRVSDSVVVLQKLLESYADWFPDFTDHSVLHSMDVLDFCNQLLGEQVFKLTIPECYVLVMSCYLHDVGMAMKRDEFNMLTEKLKAASYKRKHFHISDSKLIREFHNEYSGLFIRRHAKLFDIPSENMLFSIIQVSRGHRKTDLYDEKEYPDLETPDGVIRTAYLSAILRLADEIDVGAERNPEILFDSSKFTDQVPVDNFGTHESIRSVEVNESEIILYTKPKEPRFVQLVEDLAKKVQDTLDYCRAVAEKRSDLCIMQKKVRIVYIDQENGTVSGQVGICEN